MNSLLKHRYSLAAGSFAAFGSFFGKLAAFLKAQHLLALSSENKSTNDVVAASWEFVVYAEFFICKLLPFGLMILCNVLNWRYFLKALQMNAQTLTTTVLTTAANYTLSFLLAAFVYKEHFSWLSAVGINLIIFGLYFLCKGHQEEEAVQFKKTR